MAHIQWWLSLTGAVAILNGAVGRLSPQRARFDAGSECSVDSLGQAVAVDTTHMRRWTMSLPVGESTEGGEATVYYEAGRPRVVVILYAGEMGREIVRYYLLSSKRYVVVREQLRYEMPITIQSTPHIVWRLPSVLYVCGAQTLDPLRANDVEDIRDSLDSTLALFRGKS